MVHPTTILFHTMVFFLILAVSAEAEDAPEPVSTEMSLSTGPDGPVVHYQGRESKLLLGWPDPWVGDVLQSVPESQKIWSRGLVFQWLYGGLAIGGVSLAASATPLFINSPFRGTVLFPSFFFLGLGFAGVGVAATVGGTVLFLDNGPQTLSRSIVAFNRETKGVRP